MQAHPFSGVVMDIAVFKVSHCVGFNIDATTLQAEKARSASIGAMDEMSQKVQKAEHTDLDASFLYTFELISVAVPEM